MEVKCLLFKIFFKLRLGNLFYNLFNNYYSISNSTKLPNIHKSNSIIENNEIHSFFKYKSKSLLVKNNVKYDLQIIIPAYNAEKYITECLYSILCQRTSYKFQVIIINDGSIDNTAKMLNKYRNNKLIRIINQNNYGRSIARNKGLDYVRSKYVMFVDSDDILPQYSIQRLMNRAYTLHSDIVFGNYECFKGNHKYFKGHKFNNTNSIKLNSSNDINGYLCGKIFNSNLFNDVYFPNNLEFEDTILPFLIYPKCSKISSISSVVYFYRQNIDSISHNFKYSNVSIDSYLITKLIISSLSNYNIKIDEYIYNSFLLQVKINCLRNIYTSVKIQKSIFVLTIKLFNIYFKGYRTNMKYYKPLENDLLSYNYNDYIAFCILK